MNYDFTKNSNFQNSNFLNSSYVIIDIPDDFIFIHKFNELSKNGERVFEENEFYDKLIQFNLMDWFEKINNYGSSKNYWEQFYVDALRSNIYINNNYLYDPNLLKEKFKNLDEDKRNLIWILCSQTAYVIPYELLSKDIVSRGYYLTEISTKDSDYHNINKKMIIKISECKKKNYFVIKNSKILRIFKFKENNDITIALVNFELEFNINYPENSFMRIEFRPVYS